MRLILIRHGQTPASVRGVLDTNPPGPDLTDVGVEQASALVAAFGEEPIDALGVSTLLRTQRTAAPLVEHLGLEPLVLDGFREVEAGRLESSTDDASHHVYLETAFAWAAGDLEARIPGAESGSAFLERFDAAVAALARAETAVGISSGAAIRTWVTNRARDVDAAFGRAHPLRNTGSIVLVGSPDAGWSVESWRSDPLLGPVPLALADPTGDALT